MFGQQTINALDERLARVRQSLATALPHYIHSNHFQRDFDLQDPAELKQGIVMVISIGEQDFDNTPGLVAQLGTQRIAIVFHLEGDDASPTDVEQREITFLEEIKAWCKTGTEGMDVLPKKLEHSGQQYHPYGFATADLTIGPTISNLT